MKKNNNVLIVRLAIVSVLACVIVFFAVRLPRDARVPSPRADVIATSTAPNENVLIHNETAGYSITVPRGWYLERSAGSGVSIYPDYDGTGNKQMECKIEIASLSNPDNKKLMDWVAAYLHEDPTADVMAISYVTTTVHGASAMIWTGVLNGVSSTLAYVAAGEVVYEIAPVGAHCDRFLDVVLKNFQRTQ